MTRDELHILIQWGSAIRGLDGERFSAEETALLEHLKAWRAEDDNFYAR